GILDDAEAGDGQLLEHHGPPPTAAGLPAEATEVAGRDRAGVTESVDDASAGQRSPNFRRTRVGKSVTPTDASRTGWPPPRAITWEPGRAWMGSRPSHDTRATACSGSRSILMVSSGAAM